MRFSCEFEKLSQKVERIIKQWKNLEPRGKYIAHIMSQAVKVGNRGPTMIAWNQFQRTVIHSGAGG